MIRRLCRSVRAAGNAEKREHFTVLVTGAG
jgi:hypothetical protein